MGQFYPYVLLVVLAVNGGRSNDLCEPALTQLVQHRVASMDLMDQLPSNGSVVCEGGPCCTPSLTEHMVSRGRHFIHAIVHREATSLLEPVTEARDAFRNAMEEALGSCEQRTLDAFHRLYPRLLRHVRQPLEELFAALRASLSATDEGTVERALSAFWDDLFPFVYHSTLHSRLLPFSHGFMECLRKSRRSINPWKVVPGLVAESLAKGLNTARLMMISLDVGTDVVLRARDYVVPEECGAPAARLHFCAACHGSLVPPCSGLCLNVARGCLAPLSELDGAWTDLGSAATRIYESIKNSGLAGLMKGLPDRISDAIMLAMESSNKLQKLVRNKCGSHTHEESKEWEARTNEGLQDKPEKKNQGFESDPDAAGSLVELRASEAADTLSSSRNFWLSFADRACSHLSIQDTNCWNGLKVAAYSRPAASVGLAAQKYNPEVKIARPDVTVYVLDDELKAVRRMVTNQLLWMPEVGSYHRSVSSDEEGSGSDLSPKSHSDDEDSRDDGMGSGSPLPDLDESHEVKDTIESMTTQGCSHLTLSLRVVVSATGLVLLSNYANYL